MSVSTCERDCKVHMVIFSTKCRILLSPQKCYKATNFPIIFCKLCQNSGWRLFESGKISKHVPQNDQAEVCIIIIITMSSLQLQTLATSKWPRFSLTHWQPTICFNGKIFAKFARFTQNHRKPRVICWSQIIIGIVKNISIPKKYFSVVNYFGIIGSMKYNLHWHWAVFFQLKIHGW